LSLLPRFALVVLLARLAVASPSPVAVVAAHTVAQISAHNPFGRQTFSRSVLSRSRQVTYCSPNRPHLIAVLGGIKVTAFSAAAAAANSSVPRFAVQSVLALRVGFASWRSLAASDCR
jgi:hypothetical protein